MRVPVRDVTACRPSEQGADRAGPRTVLQAGVIACQPAGQGAERTAPRTVGRGRWTGGGSRRHRVPAGRTGGRKNRAEDCRTRSLDGWRFATASHAGRPDRGPKEPRRGLRLNRLPGGPLPATSTPVRPPARPTGRAGSKQRHLCVPSASNAGKMPPARSTGRAGSKQRHLCVPSASNAGKRPAGGRNLRPTASGLPPPASENHRLLVLPEHRAERICDLAQGGARLDRAHDVRHEVVPARRRLLQGVDR